MEDTGSGGENPCTDVSSLLKRGVVEILEAARAANQEKLVGVCQSLDKSSAIDVKEPTSTDEAMKSESFLSTSAAATSLAATTVAGLSSLEGNIVRNHKLRFRSNSGDEGNVPQTGTVSITSKRKTWGFGRGSIFGGPTLETQDYEDVTSDVILKAPVCDICMVAKGDAIPAGYYRIAKTPNNYKANFNTGSGGKTLYLCIKKALSSDEVPVVALMVIFPDKKEVVPPGYFVVRRGISAAHGVNLNQGTQGERICICYKKDRRGNPITDIQMIFPGPGKDETVPNSFSLIEYSTHGLTADLNAGTGGESNIPCISTLSAHEYFL